VEANPQEHDDDDREDEYWSATTLDWVQRFHFELFLMVLESSSLSVILSGVVRTHFKKMLVMNLSLFRIKGLTATEVSKVIPTWISMSGGRWMWLWAYVPDKITSTDVPPPPSPEPANIVMPAVPPMFPTPPLPPGMTMNDVPPMPMPAPDASPPKMTPMAPKPKGAPLLPSPPDCPPPDFGSESDTYDAPPPTKGKGKGANGFGKTGKGAAPEVIPDDSDGEESPDKPLGYWVRVWQHGSPNDEKAGVKRALKVDDSNPKHAKTDHSGYGYSSWQKGWHTTRGKFTERGEKWWPSHNRGYHDDDDSAWDHDWNTVSAASCSFRGMKKT